MEFLGNALHQHGHSVLAVRLAGHGTDTGDLERTRWEDWYASAADGLRELRAHCERVVIVGQSMGALLALSLAADLPQQVDALALLAPAIRLTRPWLGWGRSLLPLLARRQRFVAKRDAGDIADPNALRVRQGYQQIPLRALHQFLVLQARVRRRLNQVRQPVLIIHSRQDHTCALAGVDILRRGLAGKVETLILDDSYHVISVDVDREAVARRVADMIESLPALQV